MPDKKPDQLLGPLIDTTPRTELDPPKQLLLPQEVEDFAKAFARRGGATAVLLAKQAESAVRDAQIALYDYESEHPSEQARLAMLLLQAASLLVRQAQVGDAARATGKLTNGLKEYLKHHGENFVDDNLAGHVRGLVADVGRTSEYLKIGTLEAIQKGENEMRASISDGEALLAQATDPCARLEIEQTLRAARESLGGWASLASDVAESPKFAAYFSAQAICTVWEMQGAWLLEKKMKEQGQRLVMPSVESLAEKLVARFENKPRGKWGELAEDLLVDAVRLAGADPKSAKKLIREPLRTRVAP